MDFKNNKPNRNLALLLFLSITLLISSLSAENIPFELTKKEKDFLKKQPVIRFMVCGKRGPFAYAQNGKVKGIAVDYINLIAKKVGFTPEYVIDHKVPPKDAFNEIERKDSKYDTLLFAVKTKELSKSAVFGDTYMVNPLMIVTHKKRFYVKDLNELSGKTVVVEKMPMVNEWLKKEYPEVNIINRCTKEALEMVNDGKADAYIGFPVVVNFMITHHSMDTLRITAPVDHGNINYQFVAPKKWPELASILSKGYRAISPQEHNGIEHKWYSFQIHDRVDYSLLWQLVGGVLLVLLGMLYKMRKLKKEIKRREIAEKELRESKDQTELYLKTALVMILVLDTKGNIILINAKGCEILGYSEDELIGNNWFEMFIPEDIRDRVKEVHQLCLEGKMDLVEHYENEIVRRDGVRRVISWHNAILKNSFGNITGTLSSGEDITVQKEFQAKLREQEEMMIAQSRWAAMGEMIAMIAHQWRQPIAAVAMAINNLKLDIELNKFDEKSCDLTYDEINHMLKHLSATIDDFRNYFKNNKELIETSLNSVVADMLKIIGKNLESDGISIYIEKASETKILSFHNELVQALLNIVTNAKDVLLARKIENAYIKIKTFDKDQKVYISICDNGGGISPDIMDKIFDPYFTTKGVTSGTGLGLYMSKIIIQKHLLGELKVENSNEGACFTISIPCKRT